jgi:hypothetical protein
MSLNQIKRIATFAWANISLADDLTHYQRSAWEQAWPLRRTHAIWMCGDVIARKADAT